MEEKKNKKIFLIGIPIALIVIGLLTFLILSNKKTYNVSFNSDGGSVVENQKVKEGENAKEPNKPTKEKYEFVEWTRDGNTFNFNTIIESDIELVAKWKKVVLDEFEITIDPKNGEEVKQIKVLENEKLEKPEDPKYKGYIFKGWIVDGVEYDFDKEVTESFILVASWEKEKVKYTVTFDSNGGSKIQDQKIDEGEKIVKPSDPTKEDNNFVEWQLNGKTYDFENEVTSNIKLKAKWKEIEYIEYSRDAYYLRCYYEDTTSLVDIVNEGMRIKCYMDYETNGDDKVSILKYNLKYGKGLKLIKSTRVEEATESNGQYKFTYKKPESVGSGGVFTFEVIDGSKTNELYVNMENIEFITTSNKYYKNNDLKVTLKSDWPRILSEANPYQENVFHYHCNDSNGNSNPTDVKKGDKIECSVSYELYAEDAIVLYKYDIKYGKGLKLIKSGNLENAFVTGNSYYHANKNALAVASGGRFTFEVVDVSNASELYTNMENIYFKTENDDYYTSSNVERSFSTME